MAERTAKRISEETSWAHLDKLLKEMLSLAGIARVTDISETRLQRYVNRLYEKQDLEQPMTRYKNYLSFFTSITSNILLQDC